MEATDLPQVNEGTCPTCGSAHSDDAARAAPSYVYALGKIEARLPNLSVEKEFAQVTSRANTEGQTNAQAFRSVLSERQNRYLARRLCWVFIVQGLETYLLLPREPADLDLLIDAIDPSRTERSSLSLDVVIGMRGPIAPPEMCNGLQLPMVAVDQIYSFDRQELISAIPQPETQQTTQGKQTKQVMQFEPVANDVFERVLLMTDNAGNTEEHRALNYLALRYPAIYTTSAELLARNSVLTRIDTRPSTLGGARKIVDVILSYTNRNTDMVEKFIVRVDVSEEFPFLFAKLSLFYDIYA